VGGDGTVTVNRTDIYHGRIVPFVPFTKLVDGAIKGSYSQ
jgi:protein-L-isoaspartate(D-aspartate) O-methyltransferase